ncbi:MAG: hypothetical protein ABI680_08265 [Chthoniobacteraceae bacterium]
MQSPPKYSRREWHFDAVPPDHLEACYSYEYSRELVRRWMRLTRLFAIWRERWQKPKGDPDRLKGYGTFRLIHKILSRRFCDFPPVFYEFFPEVCWQDLSEEQRADMAQWVRDGWEHHKRQLRSDRINISTLRELEPSNIKSLRTFAFVNEILGERDFDQTEYGFFAIDWSFEKNDIVTAFEKWLVEQSRERETLGLNKQKKRKGGRGGFKDKLRWLGALRVREHFRADELTDYPDTNLKVDAPYSHSPDLYEAAAKAEDLIDRLRSARVSQKGLGLGVR